MKISFTNEDEIKTLSDKQKKIRHQETHIKGRGKVRHTRTKKEQIKWRYALWKKVIQSSVL